MTLRENFSRKHAILIAHLFPGLIALMTLLGIGICSGCKSDYERLVERELASGERHDSIFFGIYLGMTADSFYKHCWQLNKTRKFKQGQYNTSVEYVIEDFKYPALMNFYPVFDDMGVIVEMPVIINYQSWAPWNRKLWADSLLVNVKRLLEKWHGPGFIEVRHPEKGRRFVKVDGNRRILLWAVDEQYVKVLYSDMTKIKNEKSKAAAGNQLKEENNTPKGLKNG